ncbi:MAG: hypothetical protein Q9226_003287 [Calogaya cf. arnoldii]
MENPVVTFFKAPEDDYEGKSLFRVFTTKHFAYKFYCLPAYRENGCAYDRHDIKEFRRFMINRYTLARHCSQLPHRARDLPKAMELALSKATVNQWYQEIEDLGRKMATLLREMDCIAEEANINLNGIVESDINLIGIEESKDDDEATVDKEEVPLEMKSWWWLWVSPFSRHFVGWKQYVFAWLHRSQ